MTIGCLFGTFDPPHQGHLRMAKWMRDHQGLDEVWFIVTPRNPFKVDQDLSPEIDRLRMVELAIQDHNGLKVSDVEMGHPPPNYTADTLERLRRTDPDHRLALLMGGDNLAGFHRWKAPMDILAHHRVLVYPRPGSRGPEALPEAIRTHPNLVFTDAPLMDISATWIRQELHAGRDAGAELPAAVLAYIRQHGLYSN